MVSGAFSGRSYQVDARLFNNGALFWTGDTPYYEVPKGSGQQAIYASQVWLGGYAGERDPDDNNLRVAASTYSDWEMWPGPLDSNGETDNATCQQYDRIWKNDLPVGGHRAIRES